jgi:Sec-independent protein translocase protein TatA
MAVLFATGKLPSLLLASVDALVAMRSNKNREWDKYQSESQAATELQNSPPAMESKKNETSLRL